MVTPDFRLSETTCAGAPPKNAKARTCEAIQSGSDSVVSALIARVQHLPQGVMASLTWDRGTELAYHRKFTVATDVSVYFCDPKSPWQRGSNENTNGLLRQYFPNGTDLSVYTQRDLDQVALRLNTRPRKTLGFQTPADTFERAVALTG